MKPHHAALTLILLWSNLQLAQAVEFEPLGKAIAAILGTTKAIKKTVDYKGKKTDVYFAKAGKPTRYVFVQTGIYPPNCTHTWAIGLDAASGKVRQIRVVEMSCPHAYPTRASSYLEQYYGIGPANLSSLQGQVTTVAKATGSSRLTTDAVSRSIGMYVQHQGKF